MADCVASTTWRVGELYGTQGHAVWQSSLRAGDLREMLTETQGGRVQLQQDAVEG